MSTYLDNLREYIVKLDELILFTERIEYEDEHDDLPMIGKLKDVRDHAMNALRKAESRLRKKQRTRS